MGNTQKLLFRRNSRQVVSAIHIIVVAHSLEFFGSSGGNARIRCLSLSTNSCSVGTRLTPFA